MKLALECMYADAPQEITGNRSWHGIAKRNNIRKERSWRDKRQEVVMYWGERVVVALCEAHTGVLRVDGGFEKRLFRGGN